MAFPSAIPSYTGFTSTHTLSQDQHAAQHNAEQGDIVALAQKVGTGSSTPVNNTVLRGNGTGTTAYGLVRLDTDTAGVLGTANGGTGQTNLTSVPLVSPTITGGGSWTGAPVLSGPSIADFTNAQHNHSGTSTGGSLGNGIVNYTNLLSTIFSGQIQSASNSGSGAGSFTYINLGGLKFLYGETGVASHSSVPSEISFGVTFPSNFFNAVNLALCSGVAQSNTSNLLTEVAGLTTSALTVASTAISGSPNLTQSIFYLVIGS